MVVVRDKNGDYLLGSKKVYPEGVVRFIGGGLDKNEKPIDGAVRELKEELGIELDEQTLKPLANITATIQGMPGTYRFETYLYQTNIGDRKVEVGSDLDDIRRLSVEEMNELIARYRKLPDELVTLEDRYTDQFRWSDYGKLFGPIHRIGLTLTQSPESLGETITTNT